MRMFEKPTDSHRRLKLLLWGDSGVGKTTSALSFPSPAVVDMEGGTELYGHRFDFRRLATTCPDDVMTALGELLRSPGTTRTLVIDPVSVYCEELCQKWTNILARRRLGEDADSGEPYDLYRGDWAYIKRELHLLIAKLMRLDMNVVAVARSRPGYSEATQTISGNVLDGDRSLPYRFDVVIRLAKEDGKRIAKVEKDRTGSLPAEFEMSYDTLADFLGRETLERKARAPRFASAEQIASFEELCQSLNLSDRLVAQRLRAFGASVPGEITHDDMTQILGKLTSRAKRAA